MAHLGSPGARLEFRYQRWEVARGHVVRGQPGVEQVSRAQAAAGESEVGAQPTRERREEGGGANVREESCVYKEKQL